jgi:hypothetical protein
MPADLLEDLFPIVSCVIIPTPCIDSVAAGIQSDLFHSLAEGEVGVSIVCTEFHKDCGPQRLYDPEGKRDMPNPSISGSLQIARTHEHAGQSWRRDRRSEISSSPFGKLLHAN